MSQVLLNEVSNGDPQKYTSSYNIILNKKIPRLQEKLMSRFNLVHKNVLFKRLLPRCQP